MSFIKNIAYCSRRFILYSPNHFWLVPSTGQLGLTYPFFSDFPSFKINKITWLDFFGSVKKDKLLANIHFEKPYETHTLSIFNPFPNKIFKYNKSLTKEMSLEDFPNLPWLFYFQGKINSDDFMCQSEYMAYLQSVCYNR